RNATPIVPDSALDSVNTTFTNLEQVEANLLQFQSLADPDVISEMPPLERGQSLLMVAKATTILFALRLRCNGLHPDEHPVNAELVCFLQHSCVFFPLCFVEHVLDL
ncbi:hypothetical protein LINPERHAP1_LOCUS23326, partial [Linum perenne]